MAAATRVPGPPRVEGIGPGRGAPRSPAPRTPLPAVKTERRQRAQSVPPSLRAATLRLLRLRFSRPQRSENARNPGQRPAQC
jgi:hypothetical protein